MWARGGREEKVSHERTKANICPCRRPCAPKATTRDDQRFASLDLDRWMAALKGFHAMHLAVVNFHTLFRKSVSAQIYISRSELIISSAQIAVVQYRAHISVAVP